MYSASKQLGCWKCGGDGSIPALSGLPTDWHGLAVDQGPRMQWVGVIQSMYGVANRIAIQGVNTTVTGNITGLPVGGCVKVVGVPYYDKRNGAPLVFDVEAWTNAAPSDYLTDKDGTPSGITRCSALSVGYQTLVSAETSGATPEEAAIASGDVQVQVQTAIDTAAKAAGELVGTGPGLVTPEVQAQLEEYKKAAAEAEAAANAAISSGGLPEGFVPASGEGGGAGASSGAGPGSSGVVQAAGIPLPYLLAGGGLLALLLLGRPARR